MTNFGHVLGCIGTTFLLLLSIGCSSYSFDDEYSADLSIGADLSTIENGALIDTSPNQTVDKIEVYKSRDSWYFPIYDILFVSTMVSSIRENEFVLEIQESDKIVRFLTALQQMERDISGCSWNSVEERYHILIKDSDQKRFGYVVYRPCPDYKDYGFIEPKFGDDGVYYNKELSAILK